MASVTCRDDDFSRLGDDTTCTEVFLEGCSRIPVAALAPLTALQVLYLQDCSLVSLPEDISQLTTLQELLVGDCNNLASLPESIGQLASLKQLYLPNCSNLASLPEGIGQLTALTGLILQSCSSLFSLPKSIGQLAALQELSLHDCSSLSSLPDSIGRLTALQRLDLTNCSSLVSLPESISQLTALEDVYLERTNMTNLPRSWVALMKNAGSAPPPHPPPPPPPGGGGPPSPEPAADAAPPETPADAAPPEPAGPEAAAATAAARGGVADRPEVKDTLGFTPLVKGTAEYLLAEDTKATALAVYGNWGSGKSTFMKLVEADMLLTQALNQARAIPGTMLPMLKGLSASQPSEPLVGWPVTPGAAQQAVWRGVWGQQQETSTAAGIDLDKLTDKDWTRLKELASPRLLTVWFNSWQYLTSQEVWSGLVVEVTKQLEDRLSMKHRCCMLWGWWCHTWAPIRWLQLCCWPMALHAACAYNCRTRATQVWLRCVLPLLLVLALIVTGTVVGVMELLAQQQRPSTLPRVANATDLDWPQRPVHKGAMAAVLVMGIVGSLFAALVADLKHCKDVSDSIESGRSYMRFRRHKDKLGYQAQVLKDLKLLGQLLRDRLARFQENSGDKELRIVVFIDDLDRCKPSSIIEVLEAINVVLADSGISVVVGMDKDFVLSGIQNAYKDVKVMQSLPKAQEFLQKIVQAELTLPKPAHCDMQTYLKAQGVKLVVGDLGEDPFTAPSQQSFSRTSQAAAASSTQGTSSAAGEAGGTTRGASSAAATAGSTAAAASPALQVAPDPPPAADPAAQAAAAAAFKLKAAQTDAYKHFRKAQAAEWAARVSAQQALRASAQQGAGSQYTQGAVNAAQDAAQQCELATEAWRECEACGISLDAAEAAAAAAKESAVRAQAAARKAAERCSAAVARADSQMPSLSAEASALFDQLLHFHLLEGTTPRELKRLLNRFLLARLCCEQQVELTRYAFSYDEQQLLAWVFLWWRFPLGMAEAMKKFTPQDKDAPENLAQVLELQWSAASEAAPASSNAAEAAQQQQQQQQKQQQHKKQQQQQKKKEKKRADQPAQPPANPPTPQQVAAQRLQAAQAAVKDAEAAADQAAADTSDSAAERRKLRQKELDKASLKLELSKIAVLCCHAELHTCFNLPKGALEAFRPFGM